MEHTAYKKKIWTEPTVQILNIKKDTFSGSGSGPEDAYKTGPPYKV